ncbi:hypothetical protein ACG33_10275 [Steroidobacter denitrificans]|uniref:XRE family transcriptional regulator n=1 Tax=Steroidobacter denitrificans TaxID=465721 RepID=A0A127FD12_STEDE|nr:hypothetical protein ACG33_10275 [Steroidobacter denitrificans]
MPTRLRTGLHPGEELREWLTDINVTDAAKQLGVTSVAPSRVLNGAAAISADMDLRLSKALGTTPGTWYSMQAQRRFRAKVQPLSLNWCIRPPP